MYAIRSCWLLCAPQNNQSLQVAIIDMEMELGLLQLVDPKIIGQSK